MTHQDHDDAGVVLGSSPAGREETRLVEHCLQVQRRMEAQYTQLALQQGERLTPLSEAEREHAARLAARLHLPVPLPRIVA